MTDQEYLEWLTHGHKRCILVEVDTDTPLWLSDLGYTTAPDDAVPNRHYQPGIAGGVSINESLPLTGTARLSYGDIEIHNEDGGFDWLLDEVVQGRPIRIYYGAPDWPLSDFRLQVSGVVERLSSRRAGRLNIVMQDRLADLDVPVTEETIGSGVNKDVLKPVVFGEVHNLSAALEDAANHVYRVHDGQIERVIEVRDNGAPVGATPDLVAGTFALTQNPEGTITASVQGDNDGTYRNTIASLIEHLAVERAGWDSNDIDTANFSAFEATHPEPVGIASLSRRSVLQVCQDLAASVGAQVSVSRLAKLRLLQIDFPVTPVRDIRPEDYERGSLRISGEPDIVAAVKIGYCRNWTVQSDLTTGLPAEHHDLYGREWLTVTAVSPITATTYRLPVEVDMEETCLLTETDAQAEADRRLAIWMVPRRVFRLRGFAHLIPLQPGDGVTLYHPRYGLFEGKPGLVISARPNWSDARTDLEVLV